MPVLICLREKLWTRTYSIRDQVPTCPVFTRAEIKFRFGILKNLPSQYIYEVRTISFQTFFVWASKIGVDSWNFNMLLLYILWDDWPIFMISRSNEQLQQLEYTLLKPDCHSCWIAKMQSDTLEERYAIEFCFKFGKKCHRLRSLRWFK